ncbi:MAG: transposase [Candidatus Competibacteraceae bacterium]
MSCHPRVTEWATTLQTPLPPLSKPQIMVLAWWSLGMVLARSCARTALSACLAPWLHGKENTVRQRWREFCYEAPATRGKARQAVVVETGCAPLLAWVLSRWQGTQLALALDATTLGDRFTVLVISVVYRGCAIPIAWTVLTANVEKAWRPEWLRMRRQVYRAVPPTWMVIVLADRGLYARGRFRRMTRLGWHPFLRINSGGTFRPTGEQQGVPLKTLVPQPGCPWSGTGVAFKGRQRRLRCTLLARWEPGYQDPGLIVTELPPAVGEVGG